MKIYEKEKRVGGKVNIIENGNFTFDLTASILMRPEEYKEVFSWANKHWEDYLEFIRLDPIYRVNYADGSSYDFSSDLVKLIETLESISKADSVGYLKFLGDSYEKYLIANKYFLNKAFIKPIDFFNPLTMSMAIKSKTLSNTYSYISKYIDNEKISKMKYSCSTFIIYLGLNKKYPQLQIHNLFLGEDFKNNIEAPFKGSLPENPSIYIYCPSKIDETMAPKDKESLNIMVCVPNLLFDEIHWDTKDKASLRKRIFEKLRRIDGLEDIEENIIYESYLTPKDLKESFNSYGGTAFGLSHTLSQTNYFKPHLKLRSVKNLWFAGSSVHPGTGVSMVLLSSKLIAEEILKDDI